MAKENGTYQSTANHHIQLESEPKSLRQMFLVLTDSFHPLVGDEDVSGFIYALNCE